MKRFVISGFAVMCFALAMCMTVGAQSESLGDYARSVRKNKAEETKTAAKVYDNDNLPAAPSISVVGDSSPAADNETDKTSKAAPQPQAAPPDPSQVKPGQSQEDRQKAYEAWKKRIELQRQKIDELSTDLERYKHTATMPAAQGWPYNQQYQKGITEREKAIDDAKAELSEMQEQARKSGVPSSVAQ